MRAETTLYVIQTYIAIGKVMNNKICTHLACHIYLSPGLMDMSLHYRAPVTTPYLNSHRLVKVHVTVQLPKRLDLKP